MPLQVTRGHVRRVRRCHFRSTRSRRASSRVSALKAFTTALLPIASLSAPPMRVSSAFESWADGATTVMARVAAAET